MSDPVTSPKKVRQKLLGLMDHPIRLSDLFFMEMSDRAAAIIAATRLDDELKKAIGRRLMASTDGHAELFGPDHPLGSFSSRIRIAAALGAIGATTRSDLNWIRHIRNVFAHAQTSVHFETPEVRDACLQLSMKYVTERQLSDISKATTRDRFEVCCSSIWLALRDWSPGAEFVPPRVPDVE